MTLSARQGSHGPSELARLERENARLQVQIKLVTGDNVRLRAEINDLYDQIAKLWMTRKADGPTLSPEDAAAIEATIEKLKP